MAALSPDAICDIINERGYRWYQIRNQKGDELLDGSHVAADESAPAEGAPVAADMGQTVATALQRFGAGTYQVHLKKARESRAEHMVKLPAVVGHGGSNLSGPPPVQEVGLGLIRTEEADARTQRAIEKALQQHDEKTATRREIDDLKRQLADSQRGGLPASMMEGFTNALMIAGVALVAKIAPEALPAVTAALQGNSPTTEHATDETL